VDNGGSQEERLLMDLTLNGIPVVAVDRNIPNGKIPAVMIDNQRPAMRLWNTC
jgi:DNA-binding LacI/PurR family transcriptional regulator